MSDLHFNFSCVWEKSCSHSVAPNKRHYICWCNCWGKHHKSWISEIISDISSSEPTSKQSVQDFPQTESYIKIDFQFETGTSTIFAYEENGKHYIEQPYQGIYKIDSQLYERLQETN